MRRRQFLTGLLMGIICWIPAIGLRFGVKLPNANKDDHLGTDETDFFIQALGSKRFGARSQARPTRIRSRAFCSSSRPIRTP